MLKIKRTVVVSSVILLVLVGFILSQTLFGADKTKIAGISIFGDPSVVHAKIELPRNEHSDPQAPLTPIFHNKVVFAAQRFIESYIRSYSADFLFITGGTNPTHNIQNFGNMYLVEAPFLLLGFCFLLMKLKGRERLLVLGWLVIAPIASSITKDAPHSARMLSVLPALSITTAIGMYFFVSSIVSIPLRKIVVVVITLLFISHIGLYLDKYYVHSPLQQAEYWGVGYQNVSKYLQENNRMSKHVILSDPDESPYVFLLFYLRYDPGTYQKLAVRYPPTDEDFVHVKSFANFSFRPIDWGKDLTDKNTIVIAKISDVPETVLHSGKATILPSVGGTPAFVVITSEEK